MTAYQFCTPEWLQENARIFKGRSDAKDQPRKISAKICYRVKSDPHWGIHEDIIKIEGDTLYVGESVGSGRPEYINYDQPYHRSGWTGGLRPTASV